MSEAGKPVAEVKPRRLIDKAKAHYNALDRQRIEVPEWDAVIYARAMTLNDQARAFRMRGDDSKKWYPAVIVQMAEDEQGEKLFSFTELEDLVNSTDGRVLGRIGMAITGDRVTAEDHKGN